MPQFNIEIVDQVVATCQTNTSEVADALSRALDRQIDLEVGQGGAADLDTILPTCRGQGLLIVLKVQDSAAVLVLPESSGLLPAWYADPDPTGQSKLATLGQELGMSLLPDEWTALEFEAKAVDDIEGTLRRLGLRSNAASVSLNLTSGEARFTAPLLWPVADRAALTQPHEESETDAADPPSDSPEEESPEHANGRISDFHELPAYSRSLLRIAVPVKVTLASKRMKVSQIVELGVGAIIEFDKSCDDALNVEVGDQTIAAGEAVKVGDKFGLRVSEVVMPEERYISLKGCRRVR